MHKITALVQYVVYQLGGIGKVRNVLGEERPKMLLELFYETEPEFVSGMNRREERRLCSLFIMHLKEL